MSDEYSARDAREQQLDAIIAAYYRAVEAGECIDQKDFIAKYPEVQKELSDFFADLGMFKAASPQDQHDPALEPTITAGVSHGKALNAGAQVRYFGAYEILEELGSGGMGVVYKARQSKLKRIVAIKMIRSGELASTLDVQRFEAEAKAAARLSHPGIVSVHEVGIHHGQHFYTMDYVEGGNLSQLHRDKPIESRHAATLVRQLAESMSYAHEQGIVHRDLKPANILLTTEGTPRITDFGLAKRMRSEEETHLPTMTESGQILGTAGYMSPEQAAGKSQLVGPPADIYSLGAVLYALLTSRAPFAGETPSQTILQVLNNEPVSPRALNTDVPRDLETICLKCLRKNTSKRYGTAQELADDLTLFLARKPVRARPVSSIERVWRWCRRNSVLTVLLGVILLVLLCSPIVVWCQVMAIVDGVQDARGPALPGLIYDLKKYPSTLITPILTSRFDNAPESSRKLNLAFALATFGTVKADYLLSRVDAIDENDSGNLLSALSADRRDSIKILKFAAATTTKENNWRQKARLAIVALHLGDLDIATEMCRIEDCPDHIQRTTFIDEFPRWDGDAAELCQRIDSSTDIGLRSAVILGIGTMPERQLSQSERLKWLALSKRWYVTAADATTHSATGWLMRRFHAPSPESTSGSDHTSHFDWFINSQGQTFLKIKSGRFRQLAQSNGPPSDRDVSIPRDFWLMDTEVSVRDFQSFIEDSGDKLHGQPNAWRGVAQGFSMTGEHPVQKVSKNDVLEYCNWLSRKEGLSPFYEKSNQKKRWREYEYDVWRSVSNATGYRLPSEAEWEYACRAGSTTTFSCGDSEEFLGDYAQYQMSSTEKCGVKLPNGWGLYDMHGNIWEWCHENAKEFRLDQVMRGGAFFCPSLQLRSSYRYTVAPLDGSAYGGFRVARPAFSHSADDTPKPELTSPADSQALDRDLDSQVEVLGCQQLIEPGAALTCAHHSLDGSQILFGGHDRLARILSVQTGQVVQTFRGHESVVWSVALSPDGKTAVSGSEDRTLRLWDVESGKQLDRFDAGGIFSCVRYSSDGMKIFATNWDGKVRIWQLADGKLGEAIQFPFESATLDIVFLTNETFAFGNVAGNVLMCNSRTRNVERIFAGHSGWVHNVASLKEGKQLLSGSHDSTVRLWNTDSEIPDRTYIGHHGAVNEIRVLPGERTFLSCGADATLRLWDAHTGIELARGFGTGELRGLSVAPDGKSCVTASLDGSLSEWELPNLPDQTVSVTPQLLSPEVGEILSNGKSTKTEDYAWAFDWDDVTHASRYHLIVKNATASIAVIDRNDIPASEWNLTRKGVVTDPFLRNWTWRVRAFVNEDWTDWSETRTFHVERAR